MKQGFFKRAAALTLSAALVLPVSPMNAVAADYVVVSEQAEDTSEFVITNPGDTVNAYVGQPLVFYLRAKGAESFTITGFEALGAERADEVFDGTSGKFIWTPKDEDLTKNYTVRFTAVKGEETAVKDVKIQVGSAGDIYKTAVLPVAEDAYVQTWSGNAGKNFGGLPILVVDKSSATSLMGEGVDASDGDLSVLKFHMDGQFKDIDTGADVTVNTSTIASASLMLTYVTCKNAGHLNQTDQLNVALLPSNDWKEGTGRETASSDSITANSLKTMLSGKTYTEEEVISFAEYSLSNPNGENASWAPFKESWASAGKAFGISGRQIQTDVMKFLKEDGGTVKSGDVSFLLHETGGKQHYFVSREGAGLNESFNTQYGAFDAVADMKNTAPSLVVSYLAQQQEFGISGQNYMVLPENYAATGSDSFAVLGAKEGVSVQDMKLSGNTGGGKITYNVQEQRLEISEGLTTGAYEMKLTLGEKEHAYTVYVKSNTTLPTFTGPRKQIQAFVGRELTFYAKAENPQDFGDMVTLGVNEDELQEMDGAQFDSKTGRFVWTPGVDNGDETYELTFYAYDHSKIPVSHKVNIKVDASAQMGETDTVIPVTEDASVHSWNSERDENHGDKIYLRTNLAEGSGYLGEGTAGENADAKLSFLKFDLSQFASKMDENTGAQLVMTYMAVGSNTQSDHLKKVDGVAGIRVAALPFGTDHDFRWSERETAAAVSPSAPAVTWNRWKAWRDENNFAVNEDSYKSSKIYSIKDATMVYPNWVDNNFAESVGTRVKVDITDIIQDALKKYKENASNHELTLIMNNNSNQKLFISKEGAANLTNKIALNGEEIMAPSIVLTEPYDTEIVDGPDSVVLVEGYQDAVSNSFAVHGDVNEVSVIDRSSEQKINWDVDKRQITIEPGLKIGNYPVMLKVGDQTRRFEVRVLANDIEAMTAILAKTIKEQGRYTDAGWARYRYAVIAVQTELGKGEITGEGLIDGRSMIQSARRDLQTLEDVLYEQIEKYTEMAKIGAGLFKPETLEALNSKIQEAERLLTENMFTEVQMNAAIDELVQAEQKLEYISAKAELTNAIAQISNRYNDEDAKKYTQASWQGLQDVIKAAKEVEQKPDASDDEISGTIQSLTDAESALETLDAALVRLIKEETDKVTTEADYTEASWTSYMVVLEAVRGLEGSVYTEARMNQLIHLLQTTIAGMERADGQILCTCKVELTGIAAEVSLRPNGTLQLSPELTISKEGCEALDENHVTEAGTVYSYTITEGTACTVSDTGTISAGEEEGTVFVEVKAEVTIPNGGKSTYTKTIIVKVSNDDIPPVEDDVTITFDSDGGTKIADVTVKKGTAVSEPAKPVKEGFEFEGWYSDANRSIKYNFAEPVNADITLYAKWTKKSGSPGGIDNPPAVNQPKVGDTVSHKTGTYAVASVTGKTVTLKKGKDAKKVTIPKTVKVGTEDYKVVAIGDSAFSNSKKLQTLTICANVTKIGKNAFLKCKKLKKVTLQGKKLTVGKNAFKNTAKKATVKWPKGMKAKEKNKLKKALKKQGLKVK